MHDALTKSVLTVLVLAGCTSPAAEQHQVDAGSVIEALVRSRDAPGPVHLVVSRTDLLSVVHVLESEIPTLTGRLAGKITIADVPAASACAAGAEPELPCVALRIESYESRGDTAIVRASWVHIAVGAGAFPESMTATYTIVVSGSGASIVDMDDYIVGVTG